MEIKDNLTNEKIRMRFNNQFDLVNHAIRIAGNLIRTGREPRVKTNTENPALQAMQEIIMNKDVIDEEVPRASSFTFYAGEGKKREDRTNILHG